MEDSVMEITNVFTLENEDGQSIEYMPVDILEDTDTNKKYLLYTETDNVKDITGKEAALYASLYTKEDGKIVLEAIPTEKEWGLIENFINENRQ